MGRNEWANSQKMKLTWTASFLNSWIIGEIKIIYRLTKKIKILLVQGPGEGVEHQKQPSTAGKSVCRYNYSEEQFVDTK